MHVVIPEMPMHWKSEDVLAILDQCSANFTFPMLDNGYVYLAATRLSLHRTEADWGMVIEVFGYSPRAGMPDTNIYRFASTFTIAIWKRNTRAVKHMKTTSQTILTMNHGSYFQ